MARENLPEPDERFSKLIMDYFAPLHLFIAEGEGARCVLEVLAAKPHSPGHKVIYYADTAWHQSPGFADSLRSVDVKSIEVMANRLELLRRLPSVFSQWSPPFRVYVAASSWVISAVEVIAERAGISREQILIELCDPLSRAVTCVLCDAQTVARSDDSVQCLSCGANLRITDYYERKQHLHLGVPIDWAAPRRS